MLTFGLRREITAKPPSLQIPQARYSKRECIKWSGRSGLEMQRRSTFVSKDPCLAAVAEKL